jgi:cellulose synthase (UDP-forming)
MTLATIFLPYFFLTLYMIQRSSNFTFTYPSLALSMSAFHIHLRAFVAAATFQKSTFSITSKVAITGNYMKLVWPHLLHRRRPARLLLRAFARGLSASVVNNMAWVLLNIAILVPIIRSALPPARVEHVVITKPAPVEHEYNRR